MKSRRLDRHPAQVRSRKSCDPQIRTCQTCAPHIRTDEVCPEKISTREVRAAEIGAHKACATKIRTILHKSDFKLPDAAAVGPCEERAELVGRTRVKISLDAEPMRTDAPHPLYPIRYHRHSRYEKCRYIRGSNRLVPSQDRLKLRKIQP